jgi:hypothetical protein
MRAMSFRFEQNAQGISDISPYKMIFVDFSGDFYVRLLRVIVVRVGKYIAGHDTRSLCVYTDLRRMK